MKHKINLDDFKLSSTKKIQKALSHLNEKGELVKDRYYNNRDVSDIYLEGDEERKNKKKRVKAKRKKKGCGCK
jgi:hypothetical protein